MKTAFIFYLPVLHQGTIDLLNEKKNTIDDFYLISDQLLEKMGVRLDIASFDTKTAADVLGKLGFEVSTIDEGSLGKLLADYSKIYLVNDELGRKLNESFFKNKAIEIEFLSFFLRWDREKVFAETEFAAKSSNDPFDQKMMQAAYKLSEQSADWWRQVGAVLVKDGEIILEACNTALPDEYVAYREGAIRDQMKVGEKPELTHYIHAEQKIIAKAAEAGIALKGLDLYVTHFPCPVCAKLIAETGLARCYFSEGSSSLNGDKILRNKSVELIQVMLD
jgi:dCMP deaminase